MNVGGLRWRAGCRHLSLGRGRHVPRRRPLAVIIPIVTARANDTRDGEPSTAAAAQALPWAGTEGLRLGLDAVERVRAVAAAEYASIVGSGRSSGAAAGSSDGGAQSAAVEAAAAAAGHAEQAALRGRLAAAIERLQRGLVERDAEARLLVLAVMAGEHVLLLGPPGSAKSVLGSRLAELVGGAYFERLLTRFSVPEELFGPLSMRELENDRYVRQTRGYLPEADVAFIDEIFKVREHPAA
ncbi:hypothetical protein FOA52_012213 [Chlamydomonas sp. UWO 241]|nr:hypothetical protein FOA52_012213 [Chlamydomonas sp. UWO 241]